MEDAYIMHDRQKVYQSSYVWTKYLAAKERMRFATYISPVDGVIIVFLEE
jgi:hypothetical protein